jgi:hypothetical protein
MKTGKTLTELAQELERQQNNKRDFLADTRKLEMLPSAAMRIEGIDEFPLTHRCHLQVADRVGIPAKYYQVMKNIAPSLLATNVNWWLQTKPEKRMIRTLDGNARAFLSERYRPLDNYDLANAVLPKIQELECQVVSCEVTETRMYLKVMTERITAEVSKGDIVQAGLVISNSEVGAGSVRVEPLVYRLVCLNGMIANDSGMRKYHIGRSGGDGIEDGGASEYYRDETRQADDRAFWMKVQDVVAASLDQVKFKTIVGKMQFAKELGFQNEPEKVVELVAKKEGFTEAEQRGVLRHLLTGGELSAYGLANAITRHSQDIEDYDRATDFERLGGKVIELSQNEWSNLQSAA